MIRTQYIDDFHVQTDSWMYTRTLINSVTDMEDFYRGGNAKCSSANFRNCN
jgi:hypothetical protein